MTSRRFLFLGGSGILFLVLLVLLPTETPAETGRSKIVFDHLSCDLGSAVEGEVIEHFFPFRNTGDGPLAILNVRASCGCTMSGTTADTIGVGDTAAIFAQFNSSGKRGRINKSIFVSTNAPDSPDVVLTFTIEVRLDTAALAGDTSRRVVRRMSQVVMNEGGNIFDSRCRSCHVDPARNRTGAALYEAACAMCHGSDHHPVVPSAIALTASSYLKFKTLAHVRARIEKGTGDPMMPGFARASGGPLSKRQVDSLVAYFRSIRDSVPIYVLPRFVAN